MSNIIINAEWKNFPSYFFKDYRIIDIDNDVPDVTLACDDGALDAHKLILSAGSIFFRKVLKRGKSDQLFIYMKGLQMRQLKNMMDFMYYGQVTIDQDCLEEFIATSVEFQIKGLIDMNTNEKQSVELPGKARQQPEEYLDDKDVVDVIIDDTPEQESSTTLNSIEVLDEEEGVKVKEEPSDENGVDDIKEADSNTFEDDDDDWKECDFKEPESDTSDTSYILYTPEGRNLQGLSYFDEVNGAPVYSYGKIKGENSIIKLGATFSSVGEVHDAMTKLSDTTFCKFVIEQNKVRGKKGKRKMVFKCCFGVGHYRKSSSKGIRQRTTRYVGCPAFVTIWQSDDGLLHVVRGNLEHENHEISEESYLKIGRRRLSKDQEEAVRAILPTKPSSSDLAEFLSNITGKQYSTTHAYTIQRRLSLASPHDKDM